MKNPVDYDELSKESWDVIVVGAGPGGLVAARQCAKKKLKTICIDRKQEIGSPVRCGEGLGTVWMKFADLKYDPQWCIQEMKGAVVYGPIKEKMVIPTANNGYIVERKIMEKKIAYQAIKAGAKIMLKAHVYDVIKEKGKVSGVRVETNNGNYSIKGKILIAVDGVDSQVARYAGVNTMNAVSEVDSGFEYEMENCKFDHPDKIHIFVGNDVAPRGYAWIFPKGDTVANVGIGILGSHEKSAKFFLDKWIAEHPEIFKDAGIIDIKGGCCPVGRPLERLTADGMIIVGDAGHMVNAMHGGGMGTSMEAAMMAADAAEKAIKENDYSADFLHKNYTKPWYEKRGNQLLDVVKVRRFFEKLNDEQMEAMAKFFTPETLLEFADGKKLTTFAKLFVKEPKMMLLATKTLLIG